MSDLKDTAVTDLSSLKLVHAVGDTFDGHWELLDDWLDVVESSELEHVAVDLAGSDQGSLDGQLVEQERHVWHVHVVVGDGEWVESSTWSHGWEVDVPVWLEGGADQEVVDWGALQLLLSLGGDELGSTELHGLLALVLRRGEDNDSAAHLGGELNGQVTKSTNTEDTDGVVGAGTKGCEGRVDGRTTAHEWGGLLVWNGRWDLVKEALLPDGIGAEGSLVQVVGAVESAVGAKGLAASQTRLAVQAGVVLVAPADSVALLDGLDIGANLLGGC